MKLIDRSSRKYDRSYVDMRRSQGYTDESEKLTRDRNDLAVVF